MFLVERDLAFMEA